MWHCIKPTVPTSLSRAGNEPETKCSLLPSNSVLQRPVFDWAFFLSLHRAFEIGGLVLQTDHQCPWNKTSLNLTFIGPCNVIYSYGKVHLFLKLFILVKRSTCFGRSFHPLSGAQNCTYGNRHMSNSCCYLQQPFGICLLPYVQFWAPDDGRKDRPKQLERFIRINN